MHYSISMVWPSKNSVDSWEVVRPMHPIKQDTHPIPLSLERHGGKGGGIALGLSLYCCEQVLKLLTNDQDVTRTSSITKNFFNSINSL